MPMRTLFLAIAFTIKAVVDNRYLVEFEGDSVTVDDLRTFAKAFDYAKLAALQ